MDVLETQIARHERTVFGAILTLAAGGLDAYSYLVHGEVFAGLQTGNLILFGVHLGQGDLVGSGRYLVSLLAFFVGTIIVRVLQRHRWLGQHDPQRRQAILLYVAVVLVLAVVFSQWGAAVLGTALLSVAAAAVLQEFRRLNGGPFTPLMMTGNLRTLAETSFDALWLHEQKAWTKLRQTATIMVTFAVGAGLVALLRRWLGAATIVVPVIALLGAWWYLRREGDAN